MSRGDSGGLSSLLGALCGALCTRAAILAAPATDLGPAISAAASAAAASANAAGGPPDALLTDPLAAAAERLLSAALEHAGSGDAPRHEPTAHGAHSQAGGLSGLGAGWEWLRDDHRDAFGAPPFSLIRAPSFLSIILSFLLSLPPRKLDSSLPPPAPPTGRTGAANVLSLAADTSDAPAFAQAAFDPAEQGDHGAFAVRRRPREDVAWGRLSALSVVVGLARDVWVSRGAAARQWRLSESDPRPLLSPPARPAGAAGAPRGGRAARGGGGGAAAAVGARSVRSRVVYTRGGGGEGAPAGGAGGGRDRGARAASARARAVSGGGRPSRARSLWFLFLLPFRFQLLPREVIIRILSLLRAAVCFAVFFVVDSNPFFVLLFSWPRVAGSFMPTRRVRHQATHPCRGRVFRLVFMPWHTGKEGAVAAAGSTTTSTAKR